MKIRLLLFMGISLLVFSGPLLFAQNTVDVFLTPSDTLHKSRATAVGAAHLVGTAATFTVLASTWYAQEEQTNFHFYNDAAHWKQVDKVGHAYGAYQFARLSDDMWKWAGVDPKKSAVYSTAFSLVAMSAIEVMDGFSAKWGASATDIAANATGASLYGLQAYFWNEQRIQLKYSFHYTAYADANPQLLGETSAEQWLKDYNGQTYWLSINPTSFGVGKLWPKWLNVALGYGANGMLQGKEGLTNLVFLPDDRSYRQYYLSLDIDLTKIPTNSTLLKTVFSALNTLKVPLPTLEYQGSGHWKGHLIYF